jgi:hypothetical protein
MTEVPDRFNAKLCHSFLHDVGDRLFVGKEFAANPSIRGGPFQNSGLNSGYDAEDQSLEG